MSCLWATRANHRLQDPEVLRPRLERVLPGLSRWVVQSRLVQTDLSWRLDLSVEVSPDEGDQLLGASLQRALDEDEELMGSDRGEDFDFDGNIAD